MIGCCGGATAASPLDDSLGNSALRGNSIRNTNGIGEGFSGLWSRDVAFERPGECGSRAVVPSVACGRG